MKFINYLDILFCLIFSTSILNAQENNSLVGSSQTHLERIIIEAQKKFAPDRREAILDVQGYTDKSGAIIVGGKTNLPVAKDFIIKQCDDQKLVVKDEILLLPGKNLSDEIYGIINLSVANIRSRPAHSAELSTQSLLGTPVNILDEKDGWFQIQTPDDYISWVDDGGICRKNKAQINEWIRGKKIIFTDAYGFTYSKADLHSQTVSDLVAGDILLSEGEEENFIRVIYPDGRKAFVMKESAREFDKWLSEANPSPENLIATAKKLTGVPYLWGGTSFKGVDCSGFTKTVFFLNGVIIQRDASQQVNSGELVNVDKTYDSLHLGDLLFFGRRTKGEVPEKISHVAIYIGDLQYINASGMVRTGSFENNHPDTGEYRAFSLIRGRRYAGHIGEKGITWIKDSPYYKIH